MEFWQTVHPGVKKVFDTFDELGISTEPLVNRILDKDNPDIYQILSHMRECLAAILRTVDLIVEKQVHPIHVHAQESLNRAAIAFAKKVKKEDGDDSRTKLEQLMTWLEDDEEVARAICEYVGKIEKGEV